MAFNLMEVYVHLDNEITHCIYYVLFLLTIWIMTRVFDKWLSWRRLLGEEAFHAEVQRLKLQESVTNELHRRALEAAKAPLEDGQYFINLYGFNLNFHSICIKPFSLLFYL